MAEEEADLLEVTRSIHRTPLRAKLGRDLPTLRRDRERWTFAERVLGSGPFVERLLADIGPPAGNGATRGWPTLPGVIARLAQQCGVTEAELTGGSRRRPVAAARAAIGAGAVRGLGLPVTRVAQALGGTPTPFLRGLQRGRMLLQARTLDIEALAREGQKG